MTTGSWLDRADVQVRVGRLTWWTAWTALVVGQLHAMARHQTADGREDLELPLTRAWSDPGRRALRPLLDWADPDTVYLTYGKLWILVLGMILLCALVVRRRRRPAGLERAGWWLALGGFTLGLLSVVVEYGLNWTGYASWFDTAFTVVGIPGVLLTLLGSTVLGVGWLRAGLRPRTSAWLMTLVVPLGLVIGQVTSMGSVLLPVAFAFGLLGRRLAADAVQNETGGGVSWPVGAS